MQKSKSRGSINRQAVGGGFALLLLPALVMSHFGIDSCALVGSRDALLAIVSQHCN